jgi:hypothetical protein
LSIRTGARGVLSKLAFSDSIWGEHCGFGCRSEYHCGGDHPSLHGAGHEVVQPDAGLRGLHDKHINDHLDERAHQVLQLPNLSLLPALQLDESTSCRGTLQATGLASYYKLQVHSKRMMCAADLVVGDQAGRQVTHIP